MGRKRKFPKHKQTSAKWYQKEDQWGNFVFDWSLGLSGNAWREIFAALIILISIVVLLGFFHSGGVLGTAFSNLARKLFGGFGSYIFCFSFFYTGIILALPRGKKKGKKEDEENPYRLSKFIGLLLINLSVSAFMHLFIAGEQAKEMASYGHGGGLVGYLISNPLRNGIGLFAAFLASVALIGISLLMIFDFSFMKFLGLAKEEEDEDKVNINAPRVSVFKTAFKKLSNLKKKDGFPAAKAPVIEANPVVPAIKTDATWAYPPLTILKEADEAPNPGNMEKNVEIIKKCLETFGVKIATGEVNVGPTVSQYTFKPTEGVKLNQIVARQTDLALALSAKSLRLEAPIPGKDLVGIEIPNKTAAKVTLREILQSKEFKAVKSRLALALGRDVAGDPISIDLEKMPHLLIAGSTGSGKSVCINTLICAILFNNSPRDVRMILVDPKRVEMTCYNNIPHLLSPVVTEVDKTISALKWSVWEMERRYRMFSELNKRNIQAYNDAPGPEGKLPYIVIIIDELADLMATSAKEVEGSIVRLAQMARATGIHLVIATQRPSVDVLTGLIKANISSRIAFATASQVDSRTILDISGAEKLLGNGDMLFLGNGVTKPKRIQGSFVSDPEIEELCNFLRENEIADYDESVLSFKSSSGGAGGIASGDGSAEDDLYDEALETVVRAGKASASLLQRRLRIGYARAARLLDILEQNGAIGPAEGAKPRDVLVSGANAPFSNEIGAVEDDGFDQNQGF